MVCTLEVTMLEAVLNYNMDENVAVDNALYIKTIHYLVSLTYLVDQSEE